MIGLAIALSFTALVALCLAMQRHYTEQFGASHATPQRLRLLRWTGWLGLASTFALCVESHGWAMGPVLLLGAITVAGLVLTLALRPYRARLIVPLALGAPPLAALFWLCAP